MTDICNRCHKPIINRWLKETGEKANGKMYELHEDCEEEDLKHPSPIL